MHILDEKDGNESAERENDQKNDPERWGAPQLSLLTDNDTEDQTCLEEKTEPLGIYVVFSEHDAEGSKR